VLWQSSIVFYDRKKKRIVKVGESRPNCVGSSKLSIHAEERAIKECLKLKKNNKLNIYIWRYDKYGKIKNISCCKSCTNLANKYNFYKRIYTFKDGNIIPAIIDNPKTSLGNMIRNNEF